MPEGSPRGTSWAMGKLSRRKGHAFEREIAAELREMGFNAKRGLSQARGGGAEEADVVGLHGFHLECKRGKKPNPRAALSQAIEDAKPGETPVAVVRDDRSDAFVVLRWEDFIRMLQPIEHPPEPVALLPRVVQPLPET